MDDPDGRVELVDHATLEASSVVANCAMNRGRQLAGVNSYARELGFNPVDLLAARVAAGASGPATVGWLDLCCGSGRALVQAAEQLQSRGLAERTALVGVDLVGDFDPIPTPAPLELIGASVSTWSPTRSFDLVTCVHGLHYVGDKLGVLARAASWLSDTGMLVADLDLASIRQPTGQPAGRRLAADLRAAGFSYDARRRRITRTGRRELHLPYTYLGADARAGANYTGQPAVHSYYSADTSGQAAPNR